MSESKKGFFVRIAHIEICNFRGIAFSEWSPRPGINCLIGPGDATKTTLIDAIEFALTPRTNFVVLDTDLFDGQRSANITVTLIDLPAEFYSETCYGLHLRGWNEKKGELADEPGNGFEEALSIRVSLDHETLEARWSIFNQRLQEEEDPPSLRSRHIGEVAPTRLGPYADRHLGWGRYSLLSRLGDGGNMNSQLAQAARAARDAFRASNKDIFKKATTLAEEFGRRLSIATRNGYVADLDIQRSGISAQGVVLHDGNLPLRTLGTGSARLLVAALQHGGAAARIALVDEVEHGLEPHRIARLLKFLKAPLPEGAQPAQVFMTSHSPVVVLELSAEDIHTVRHKDGLTTVRSVEAAAQNRDTAQRHLRSVPEAFLARRIFVGEGRTECGLLRGLDDCWVREDQDSFAHQGIVAVDGGGIPKALIMAEHLLKLGFEVSCLIDSDKPIPMDYLERVQVLGGNVLIWEGSVSTEQRIFLDVPWDVVCALISFATECNGADRVLETINSALPEHAQIPELVFPNALDTGDFRAALGKAAMTKGKAWFKDMERGEVLAYTIFDCLKDIEESPLAKTLLDIRRWIDG